MAAAMVSGLHATVLEDFESISDWTTVVDPRSYSEFSTVPGENSGNALNIYYSLRNGSYVGLGRSNWGSVNVNTVGANALRFFYKASSISNTVEVKFSDSDYVDPGQNTKAVLKFPSIADNQWHEVIAPFNSFAVWTDTGRDGDSDSATFDWDKISHLSYGVSGNSGVAVVDTIRFDDFSFYDLDAPVPLVNSYENFVPGCWVANTCLNERASPLSSIAFDVLHPEWGSSMIVSTQAAPGSGTHSREIRYTLNAIGSFFGIAEVLEVVSVLPTDRIEFYAMGAVGGEPLHVQVKSSNQTTAPFATVESLSTALTTSWQKYSVPFSSLVADPTGGADLDLDQLSEVVFLFEHSGVAKNGRVYIDDVRLVRPGAGSLGSVMKVLEDFSRPKLNLGYGEYPRDDVATLDLAFEEDESIGSTGNRVGRMDYSFESSAEVPWAVVEKPLAVNLLDEPQIRFLYKGDGSSQNIEVFVSDTDGTTFKKTLFDATNTGGKWTTLTLPIDQFSFEAPGEDSKMKLTLIDSIGLFLVPGGTSTGTFTIDSLELTSPIVSHKTDLGGLISSVSVPDNPFSPNGDGLKDEFTVNYVLQDASRVVFKVFNLQGVPLHSMDLDSQPAGANTLTWDGRDRDGDLVANGIYFFILEAKSDFSGDATFRQVVGIAR